MKTTKEMIEVMQAFVDGKSVEYQMLGDEVWHERRVEEQWDSYWNWGDYDYRIKKMPRECWVNVYDGYFGNAWETKEEADEAAGKSRTDCLRVREVIE